VYAPYVEHMPLTCVWTISSTLLCSSNLQGRTLLGSSGYFIVRGLGTKAGLTLRPCPSNWEQSMSWRDKAKEDCEMCQVLYCDDGPPLGCVLRLHGGEGHLRLHDHGRAAAPGRVPDRRGRQARGRVRAREEAEVGAADSGSRTPFRPDTPRVVAGAFSKARHPLERMWSAFASRASIAKRSSFATASIPIARHGSHA
jgi:hypothetical protein